MKLAFFALFALFASGVMTASFALAQTPEPMLKRVAPGEPPAMKRGDIEAGAGNAAGTIMMPKVFFIEPKDGATVKSEVTLKFGIEGMKVSKAG
ncbi:MAG: hypothetical protein AAB250_05750, partial [Bdellovibrionota bacterium]